jgi:hypothetical protein
MLYESGPWLNPRREEGARQDASFSEEKEAKDVVHSVPGPGVARHPGHQVQKFFGSFFQKRTLPS